jgi:hypothetical protein
LRAPFIAARRERTNALEVDMTTAALTDADGPVIPPTRALPEHQFATARQRTDGTIVTDGPGPILDTEVAVPKRWIASVPWGNRKAAIEEAVQPLVELAPPSPSASAFAAERLMSRGLQWRSRSVDIMVLVRAPGLDIGAFARALASALFRDPAGYAVFDCASPDNGDYELFGAPLGCRGCLEGGLIANQMKLRPESVIVLDNVEYADYGTLVHIRSFARDGRSLLVSRGAQVTDQRSSDEVFVLATTRGFPAAAQALAAGRADAFETVLSSLKRARPELDWNTCQDAFVYGRLCAWGALVSP